MIEVENYVSSAGEKGIQIEIWQPGLRERKVGWLRIILANNSRKLEDEEIRIEIDIPEGKVDTTPEEKASFYLPLSVLTEGILKMIQGVALKVFK